MRRSVNAFELLFLSQAMKEYIMLTDVNTDGLRSEHRRTQTGLNTVI